MENLKFATNRKKVQFCPCGRNNKDGKFVPFRGYEDSEDKGYCHSCEKTFLPDQENNSQTPEFKREPPKKISYIPEKYLSESINDCHKKPNAFIRFTQELFSTEIASFMVNKFKIGNTRVYKDGVLFWYVNRFGNIVDAKAMPYKDNGKRKKSKAGDTIEFYSRKLKKYCYMTEFPEAYHIGKSLLEDLEGVKEPNTTKCLFGEHQLSSAPKNKTIALVESEKTCVWSSLYFPEYVWLATGGKTGAKIQHLEALKNREVIIFPDQDAHSQWEELGSDIKKLYDVDVIISDYVLNYGNKFGHKNIDLVDVLVKQDKGFKPAIQDSYPLYWDIKNL